MHPHVHVHTYTCVQRGSPRFRARAHAPRAGERRGSAGRAGSGTSHVAGGRRDGEARVLEAADATGVARQPEHGRPTPRRRVRLPAAVPDGRAEVAGVRRVVARPPPAARAGDVSELVLDPVPRVAAPVVEVVEAGVRLGRRRGRLDPLGLDESPATWPLGKHKTRVPCHPPTRTKMKSSVYPAKYLARPPGLPGPESQVQVCVSTVGTFTSQPRYHTPQGVEGRRKETSATATDGLHNGFSGITPHQSRWRTRTHRRLYDD